MPLRVLLLADSHLGYDLPVRPRVHRRRRGRDFQENYERALAPALDGRVDLVVHGGDVFNRARVPPSLVYQAFEPLRRVARAGVPVFVVPGNHERGRIPHTRLASHPGVHVFDRPRTFSLEAGGLRIDLAGFPYARKVRGAFTDLLAETGWTGRGPDISLLCVHHCFEGATVGPADFTFRRAPDVIRGADIPGGFAAVLTGHIHRHQVLTADLAGRPLPAPVLYPGSVERTAFAEIDEEKGYMLLDFEAAPESPGGRLAERRFVPLPARPMLQREVRVQRPGPSALAALVLRELERVPADAVLRLRIRGAVSAAARASLTAARLRALAPPEMNLEVILDGERKPGRSFTPTRQRSARGRPAQLEVLTAGV